MFSRLVAGVFAVLFVVALDRSSLPRNPRPWRLSMVVGLVVLLVLAVTLMPRSALAGSGFADGARVRIASSSIESGWHIGRVKRDARKCWMVQLDKATAEGYTMLALMVVNELQIAQGAGWTAVHLKPIVQAQHAECLEAGSD